MILTDEGYVTRGNGVFKYYYYLKDHLGNNRVVMDASGQVVQTTDYYASGLSTTRGTNPEKQPYKYNGKELDRMFGLDTYDYSARMYDPAMGRFMTMDPLAEKYYSISPYAYCNNNPVRFTDPTGMWIEDEDGFHTRSEDEIRQFVQQNQQRQEKFSFDNVSGFFKAMGNVLETAFQETFFEKQSTPSGKRLKPKDLSASMPDYVGLTISGDVIVGGGGGIDLTLGHVKNDG